MSEEFEALEILKKELYDVCDCYKNALDCLETALKEKCALDYLMRGVIYTFEKEDFTLEKLGKKLKALEIIKENEVYVALIRDKNCTLKIYNKMMSEREFRQLTRKKYDLLREILNEPRKDSPNK